MLTMLESEQTETAPETPISVRGAAPKVRFCRECGAPFYPGRTGQEFCKPGCRTRHHRRRYDRGAQLYDFAMEWRGKRLKGGFTRLCQMIDGWLADERQRGKEHARIREAHRRQAKQGSMEQ